MNKQELWNKLTGERRMREEMVALITGIYAVLYYANTVERFLIEQVSIQTTSQQKTRVTFIVDAVDG